MNRGHSNLISCDFSCLCGRPCGNNWSQKRSSFTFADFSLFCDSGAWLIFQEIPYLPRCVFMLRRHSKRARREERFRARFWAEYFYYALLMIDVQQSIQWIQFFSSIATSYWNKHFLYVLRSFTCSVCIVRRARDSSVFKRLNTKARFRRRSFHE